jgi:hypothetical protein
METKRRKRKFGERPRIIIGDEPRWWDWWYERRSFKAWWREEGKYVAWFLLLLLNVTLLAQQIGWLIGWRWWIDPDLEYVSDGQRLKGVIACALAIALTAMVARLGWLARKAKEAA